MKKIMMAALVCLMAVAMTSCGVENSPKGVATEALKCLQKKDYKGYVNLMELSESDQQTKDQLVQMLEAKGNETMDRNGGLKSFEIVDEDVQESRATVTAELTWGNGDVKKERLKLVKNDAGKWRLDSKK